MQATITTTYTSGIIAVSLALKVQNQNLTFNVQIGVSNSDNFPYILAVHTHQWYVFSLPN
jgi:hypothetical protein